ncbi:MAG: CDP-diacylglycerol--glycerol-3-phosphate 3-phosphatidyltransferase [Gammaproteobacteria bacterium]|nr:CDP-diacylglycerol--glycerol-3-phosphate 3-phosphatidyltransferase [Gammaproteobacteria bacterium]
MTNKAKNFNFPNSLTLFRIILIPFFIVIYYLPITYHYEIAALIFTVASLTDWLDGFMARRLQQETNFGAFLDPIADKLIVVIALMMLLGEYNSYWITVPAIIIVSREIMMSGLREWMAQNGLSQSVKVSKLAKAKTAMQMIAIIILLSRDPIYLMDNIVGSIDIVVLGVFLLLISTVLTVTTVISYLIKAYKSLSNIDLKL